VWQSARVTTTEAIDLLERFRAGKVSREKVLRAFQAAPVANLGFAQVDTHRALRKGFPEVIFGAGKTPEQVVKIAAKLLEHEQSVLVTRVTPEHAKAVRRRFKWAVHHETGRCLTLEKRPLPKRPGTIAVVCAGTSDLPVARKRRSQRTSWATAWCGLRTWGVAGVHRLFGRLDTIKRPM
jgi:NCAIR mutase (PurE)-related protein